MRTLRRNKIRIFCANYRDKIPLRDEYGNLTGEYQIQYDNPIALLANVSAVRGEASIRQFGYDEGYDKVIVLDSRDASEVVTQAGRFESTSPIIITDDGEGNVSIECEDIRVGDDGGVQISMAPGKFEPRGSKFPITVSTVFWIETLPEIAEDGSTDTPHDYIVKQVAMSLNSVSIAVSKVNVRG